jgi:hypothetical protein
MKLEEIAPYLPYGLRCITKLQKVNGENWGKLLCYGLTSEHALFYPDGGDECAELFEDIKPIVRPLDLTREIEHNGKKFVPIEVLLGVTDETRHNVEIIYREAKIIRLSRWDVYCNFEDRKDFVETVPINTFAWPFYRVQKLLEWHFDVFGLIERGEAIDINTLNE